MTTFYLGRSDAVWKTALRRPGRRPTGSSRDPRTIFMPSPAVPPTMDG
jgi:hypothetical protein